MEEDKGKGAIDEDGQTEDHVVEHEEATLIREVGHHGLEVGLRVEKMVLDSVDEDGSRGDYIQSTD